MTKAQKENQARFKKVQAEAKKLKAKNPRLAHTAAVKQAWAILYNTGKAKPVAKKKIAAKKVGNYEEEEELDYNSIPDLQAEIRRLNRWASQYNSKGQDATIKRLEKRVEYLQKQKSKKKIGAVKKKVVAKKKIVAKKQTGKTKIAIDKKLQAKPVGKRISKSGNVYYEARANRSDKGRLLGVKKKPVAKSYHKDTQSHNVNVRVVSGVKNKANLDIIDRIARTIKDRDYALNVSIPYWEKEYKMQSSPSLKRNAKKYIALGKKLVKETNTHIKELKKLI